MNNIEVKTIYGRIEDFENNYFFSPYYIAAGALEEIVLGDIREMAQRIVLCLLRARIE